MRRSRRSEVLSHLAANVRRLRIKRGLTQAVLAELADQDLSYLQRIERGVTNVSVAVIVALADALETPPASLFRATRELARPTGRPIKRKTRTRS